MKIKIVDMLPLFDDLNLSSMTFLCMILNNSVRALWKTHWDSITKKKKNINYCCLGNKSVFILRSVGNALIHCVCMCRL
jgi:hypothetical protein